MHNTFIHGIINPFIWFAYGIRQKRLMLFENLCTPIGAGPIHNDIFNFIINSLRQNALHCPLKTCFIIVIDSYY